MGEETTTAPWTDDQVERLNAWQNNVHVHPFTCAYRGVKPHPWKGHDRGILIATNKGWICEFCDYTQDWAFSIQLEEPPEFHLGFFTEDRDG